MSSMFCLRYLLKSLCSFWFVWTDFGLVVVPVGMAGPSRTWIDESLEMGTFYRGAPCDVPCGIRRSEGVSGRIVLLHALTVGNESRASSPSASRPSRQAQGARELRIQLFRGSCCRLRSVSSTVLAEDSLRLFARMIHFSGVVDLELSCG